MNSQEDQDPHYQPQPNQHNRLILKLKPLFLLSILVVFLAISIGISNTNYYRVHYLKSTISSPHNLFQKAFRIFKSTPNQKLAQTLKPNSENSEPPFCVLWMAPFLSGGGYSSEAWSYILALHDGNPFFRLSIEQHGDLENTKFWEGLPSEMRRLAFQLYQTECRLNETIVICHSEPGAWYPPLFETLPCPPTGYGDFKYVVGRTMFETDRVNIEHVKRCNQMDSVWVPTEFHVSTFIQSGVDASKVVKIVQPVDWKFFDPVKYKPLDLGSIGTLVLGSTSTNSKIDTLVLGSTSTNSKIEYQFVFLSVFKWEYRKGWDVLLQAYLKEFSEVDGVALYLLTNPYHSGNDFGNKILEFVENSSLEKPVQGWAPVYVIDIHIAQIEFPRIYKAANAFVLPSRGEGWGRPLVEAMAMSLPVIATNWSGPTEYLTEENSYPLPIDRMREVLQEPFKGHLWAEPSVDKLRNVMRHVMSNLEEAKAKGNQAREDMINRFSPEIVAGIVTDHVQRILDKMV